MGYKSRINHVTHGSSATAGNVGTPDRELQGNVDYVKALIDASFAGQALFAREQTLESTLQVGQAVYWDAASATFRPALAAATTNASGQLVAAATAEVIGVVASKSAADKGDVLLAGYAAVDLTEAVDGNVTAGRYYLSGTQAGMLVQARPAAATYVLYAFGNGYVVAGPASRDFLEDHVHYSFELACQPAGTHTPPSFGNRHSITGADPAIAGWLPANHSSFDGKAPADAAFGYNLAAEPNLLAVWPPVPVGAAASVWDKGDGAGGTDVPLGASGLVVVDANGIWWMSDCYGDVPWPTDFTSSEGVSSEQLECPRSQYMRLRLDFVRMSFATDRHVVTSLRSLTAGLEVLNCDGSDVGMHGDLCLQLDLGLTNGANDVTGDLVVKDFDDQTQTLERGPVVEAVVAGSGITLSSTRQTTVDGVERNQGTVTVSVDALAGGRDIAPQIVRIQDLADRYDGSAAYLAFPSLQASALRNRYNIPSAGIGAAPAYKLRLLLLATAAGTPPAITLTAIVIARPTGTPQLPSGDTSYALNVPAAGTCAAGDYFEVESEAIPVTPGATVFLSLSRAAGDGYSGEIGILRQDLILQS